MNFFKNGIFLSLSLASMASPSCKPKVVEAPDSSANTQGVAIPESKLWTKSRVGICWENSKKNSDNKINRESVVRFMSDVENLTKKGLQNSKIQVVGWKECVETEKTLQNVRVFVYDDPAVASTPYLSDLKLKLKGLDGPSPKFNSRVDNEFRTEPGGTHARETGQAVDGMLAGLVLNLNMEEDIPNSTKELIRTNKLNKQQIYNVALTGSQRAIGQLLGLRNERMHSESTCEHGRETLGDGRDVGSYSEKSIMNSCFNKANYGTSARTFIDDDIKTLNTIYSKM
jgi:hypothetical protein